MPGNNNPTSINTTTSGKFVFPYIQKKCGDPWRPMPCSNITGLTLDPSTMTYNLCIGVDGRRRNTKVKREDDPRPITVTYDLTNTTARGRALALHERQRRGNLHNMLIKFSDCPLTDADALNPTRFDDAIMLYGMEETGGFQFGNNTLRTRDDKQADDLLGQTDYVFSGWQFLNKYSFGSVLVTVGDGGASDGFDSLDVWDNGKAVSDCVPCETAGCQVVLASDANDFVLSTNGMQTFALAATASAGARTAIVGDKLFLILPTTLQVSGDGGASFVAAVTDVAFAGLADIAMIDANNYVLVGATSQVWMSTNQGFNWSQITPSTVSTVSWTDVVWAGTQLWAVGTLTTNAIIGYSNDFGRTFTTVGTVVAGANTPRAYYAGGNQVFFHINSLLYRTSCSLAGAQVVTQIVGPYGSAVTGVGGSALNCNELFVTTSTGKIYRTIDGGGTWDQMSLGQVTITTPQLTYNPITACNEKVYFGFGKQILTATPSGANGASVDAFA